MPIEIEKKYRLTAVQREQIVERLNALNAQMSGTELEVNTIYRSPALEQDNAILRLRRVGPRAILTFKKRFTSASAVKRQLEEETEVLDADAMERILVRVGFTPSLVYEKRRQSWVYLGVEIVLDELPFGWFMEIEAAEPEIETVEQHLSIEGLQSEESTYPGLTRRYGTANGDVIEARF